MENAKRRLLLLGLAFPQADAKGGRKAGGGGAALDVEPKVDLDTESPTAKESGANRGLETIGEKGAWDESVSFASRQRHVAVEKRKD